MWRLVFKTIAFEQLKRIDIVYKKRIKKKLEFFIASWNPLFFAKKLTNSKLWTYRFRIWDYRIIFDIDKDWKIIIVALIWKRWEIYK